MKNSPYLDKPLLSERERRLTLALSAMLAVTPWYYKDGSKVPAVAQAKEVLREGSQISSASRELTRYLDSEGLSCFYCGSIDINAGDEPECAGITIYQNRNCRTCKKEWTDEYTLTGVAEL